MKHSVLLSSFLIFVMALAVSCASSQVKSVPGETDTFVMNGTREIPVTIVIPEGNGPFPLVVINHGHGGSRQENGGFAGVAKALSARGIASIRMDFPGCGDSKVSFMENNLTNMISDSNACRDFMVKNYPIDKKNMGLLGYSMGGRVSLAIMLSKNNPYKAAGLLAPATYPYDTPQNQANYRTALKDGVYKQPWYGRDLTISPKFYEDLFAFDKVLENLPKMNNVMIVYGDKDDMVPPAVCRAAADKLGAKTVEVKDADHGYGFYSDQPAVTALVEGSFADFFAGVFAGK